MKKIVIHKAGSFDQLKVEEHPDLEPKAGEIKVAVQAIGINYADVIVRWGLYKSARQFVGWPITPGFEFAGTVVALGAGASGFELGQEVFGVTLFNAYATEVCVPQHRLYAKPATMSMAEAAGFPSVFMTAYHAMFQNIVVRQTDKILVHSAAGGVGSALLQICRLKGMETIGVVGSSHKVDRAKAMGAAHVIDKSKQDLWCIVEQLWPGGAHVIFDANGGQYLKDGWAHLTKGGKLVSYGSHTILPKESGRINWLKLIKAWIEAPRFNVLNFNTRSLITFNLSFLFDRDDLMKEAMDDLLQWVADGSIAALETTTYKFEDVAQAHKDLQSGQTMGKLVLVV